MRAVIVAAVGFSMEPLIDSLRDSGITEAWVLRSEAGDSQLFDPMPDLTICVLDADQADRMDPSPSGFTNLDVMMRAGQAAGRGIPTLIIAPPPLVVSASVAPATVTRCRLDQPEALADSIWAFAARAKIGHHEAPVSESKPNQISAASYLSRLARIAPANIHDEVGQLIAELLSEAGAALTRAAAPIDLAFIPSEESAALVLLEIKTGVFNAASLTRAEAELSRQVETSQAQLGVLLYYDVVGEPHFSYPETGRVVRIRLEDLIKQLGYRSLTEILNAAVVERGSVAL